MTRDEMLTLILARVRRAQARAYRAGEARDYRELVASTREARALLDVAYLIKGAER